MGEEENRALADVFEKNENKNKKTSVYRLLVFLLDQEEDKRGSAHRVARSAHDSLSRAQEYYSNYVILRH